MKFDKFIKIILGLIAVLLFSNLFSGFFGSQTVSSEDIGRYELFYDEGIGRYQISSWAAQTGRAGAHHYGYFVLDTVTGKVVEHKMEVYTPERSF